MACNRDAHLIHGKSRSYKAGWVKLCPRIDANFSLLLRESPAGPRLMVAVRQNLHPVRLATADAPATRQGTPGDGRQRVSEAGQLDALGTHPATTKRGGAQVGRPSNLTEGRARAWRTDWAGSGRRRT